MFVDPSEVVEAKAPRRRGRDKPVGESETVPSKAPVVSSEVRPEAARQSGSVGARKSCSKSDNE